MKKLLSITAVGLLAAALVSTSHWPVGSTVTRRPTRTRLRLPPRPLVGVESAGSRLSRSEAGQPDDRPDRCRQSFSFSTLVSLLQLTGLDAVVDSSDVTLTVFAPTNDCVREALRSQSEPARNPHEPGSGGARIPVAEKRAPLPRDRRPPLLQQRLQSQQRQDDRDAERRHDHRQPEPHAHRWSGPDDQPRSGP